MADQVPVITLDGPGGVGKGTISMSIAKLLDWNILDSGSLYRLTALAAKQAGITDDKEALVKIASSLQVRYEVGETELRILLENEDVTDSIRTEEIGRQASFVAMVPEVRVALKKLQKSFAKTPGLVADGRDMGRVVFPQAILKIFLTASPEERAKRRYKQLIDKGINANLPHLIKELNERDERDLKRAASPLKPAEDAVTVDTTDIGIDEVVNRVMELVKQRFQLK